MPIRGVNLDDSNPTEKLPAGAPTRGQDAVDNPADYPTTIRFRISDCYLADINGPALHVGANTVSADILVENVHIDGADYGVIADGVKVIVRGCEIKADEPFGTVNGGSITPENTNTGSDASPRVPDVVPTSPEEAAGDRTQL